MTVLHQRTHVSFVMFASECSTMIQKATNWGNSSLILMLILEPLVNIKMCTLYFQEMPVRSRIHLKQSAEVTTPAKKVQITGLIKQLKCI